MKNTKRVSDLLRFALMGVVAFGLSACASSSGGATAEGEEGEGVGLVVINDASPPAPVTVYIIPETGQRRRLGDLQPNAQQTFRYQPIVPSQQFTILAEAVGESDRRSESFTLIDIAEIEWRTSSRNVRIRR